MSNRGIGHFQGKTLSELKQEKLLKDLDKLGLSELSMNMLRIGAKAINRSFGAKKAAKTRKKISDIVDTKMAKIKSKSSGFKPNNSGA